MEKALYNELVDKKFITDVTMTLEDINAKGAKLEDILTQPAAYEYYSKLVDGDATPEETSVEEPVVEPTMTEPVIEEPDVEPADDPEEIVVDDEE